MKEIMSMPDIDGCLVGGTCMYIYIHLYYIFRHIYVVLLYEYV
jgi:triosephosphate isomerase